MMEPKCDRCANEMGTDEYWIEVDDATYWVCPRCMEEFKAWVKGGPVYQVISTPEGERIERIGASVPSSTLKPFTLPTGFSGEGYRLLKDIMGEMRWEDKGESETKGPYVATVGLPGGSEYGDGSSEKTALLDLLVSLGEYRKSLEAREATLDGKSREDLAELRLMVEKVP